MNRDIEDPSGGDRDHDNNERGRRVIDSRAVNGSVGQACSSRSTARG